MAELLVVKSVDMQSLYKQQVHVRATCVTPEVIEDAVSVGTSGYVNEDVREA